MSSVRLRRVLRGVCACTGVRCDVGLRVRALVVRVCVSTLVVLVVLASLQVPVSVGVTRGLFVSVGVRVRSGHLRNVIVLASHDIVVLAGHDIVVFTGHDIVVLAS